MTGARKVFGNCLKTKQHGNYSGQQGRDYHRHTATSGAAS